MMITQDVIDMAMKLKYGSRKAKNTVGTAILEMDKEGIDDLIISVQREMEENKDDKRLLVGLSYIIEFINARSSSNMLQNGARLVIKNLKKLGV